MLLMSTLLWGRAGVGVWLGTRADCSVALTTWLLRFLWQRIWITPKSSCQQTGHILQSQRGNQMWIACELYVATCLSSWDSADHWQCCGYSVIMYIMGSVISVRVYTHKHTHILLKIAYRIGTPVKGQKLSLWYRIYCVATWAGTFVSAFRFKYSFSWTFILMCIYIF